MWRLFLMMPILLLATSDESSVSAKTSNTADCETVQAVEGMNKWGPKNRLGHYTAEEAYLYVEFLEEGLISHYYDEVVIWGDKRGGPASFAVIVIFSDGCAVGKKFIEKSMHGNPAAVVERYRESGGRPYTEFLSTAKQEYYLGEQRLAEGKYEEAERLFLAALVDWERVLGHIDPAVNQTRTLLGAAQQAQDKFESAEQSFKTALEGWRSSLGPGSAGEADTLEYYADLLRKIDRTAEAVELERKVLSIRSQSSDGSSTN